jgi:putative membrane protein
MELSRADHARITAAIVAAERRTSGEIVCVMAHASSDDAPLSLIWSSALALATPWPLIVFTRWPVQWIFLAQLLVFMLAFLALASASARFALVPRKLSRRAAHRLAMEQFVARGMTRTNKRTGVLIFVSLAERYARIIGDEAIDAKVRPDEWRAALGALTSHLADGRLADGYVAAIERCADLLARHFPRGADDVDVLPNRLFVI